MLTMVLSVLGLMTAGFTGLFIKDVVKNPSDSDRFGAAFGVGFVTDFFDTLGIGSFAPTTILLKQFKLIEDRYLPGVLNISHTIPVVLEAFIFMKVIEVEAVTLVSMLAAAVFGAVVGAGVVAKLPEKKIQLVMGIALFVTATLMVLGKVGLMPSGGDAIGLSGVKLVIAVVGNFILGALMTAGIGMYAPCMALIYMLGMSAKVAFPIMMGSCAFLMPAASVKFIKEGAYNRRVSLGITIGGVVGVVIAAYLVKTLPLDILTWIVIAVIYYASVTMIRDSKKEAIKA